MSVLGGNPLLLAGGDDGYKIGRSVRLRSSASANFDKGAVTTNTNLIWTYSTWIKRGSLGGTNKALFSAASAANSYDELFFHSSDVLYFQSITSSAVVFQLITTQVFRDPSAWYHIVLAIDTTQATASNRVKLYVNGLQVTSFSTASYPSQNYGMYTGWTSSTSNTIGRFAGSAIEYFDGYLAETNFVTGQALTPSSFGETDAVTGVWKPKKYGGTYGTNGFYLNFSDPSAATAAAIGKDYSGNGNNWTPNNISVTAGVTYDSMLDVPTLGETASNHCVLNPLTKGSSITISNGNLDAVGSVNTNTANTVLGSIAVTSGKWYAEFKVQNTYTYSYIGVADPANPGTYPGANSAGYSMEVGSGATYNVTAGPTISGAAAGDTVMVALDMDNGKIWWGKNGTWGGSGNPAAGTGQQFSGLTGTKAFMLSAYASSGTFNANFGQRPFTYTPPTGFKALNTQNLPDATIKKGNDYFDSLLWTSTATVKDVTGSNFQPDLVWVKSRASASANEGYHHLVDAVRGAGKVLSSNGTDAEYWVGTNNSVQAFLPNGFTAGDSDGLNGNAMVSWLWKESASAGFDIVTYTGTSSVRTVAHSLGVAPKMIIGKSRSGSGASFGWNVYHASLGNTGILQLNNNNAFYANSIYWNNTTPSSTDFTLGANSEMNNSGSTYVAYLFAEVAGFSKFGSYTGNGSADGPFVYLGFRPRFVIIKRATDVAANWRMVDTARDGDNVVDSELYPNLSNAEAAFAALDITANGFKLRTSDASYNSNTSAYVYACFAENPFKNSLAR